MDQTLRALTFCLALLAGLGSVAGAALAQDQPVDAAPADEVRIAEEIDGVFFVTWIKANVRAEPSSTAAIVARLPFGTQLTVTGEVDDGPWLRVETDDGQVGYVWEEVLHPAIVTLPGAPAPDLGPGSVTAPDGFEPSDDNDFASAQIIPSLSGTPAAYRGMVGPSDQRDYYRFELDDWTNVVVTLNGLGSDADVGLLDEAGDYLIDSVAAGTQPERMEYVVGPGTYFIEVYIYEGQTAYTLNVSGAPAEPPPPDDAGQSREEAFDLGVVGTAPAVYEGWVGHGDDVDYIGFRIEERIVVSVAMDGLRTDADIALEDDFGSVLGSSTAGGTAAESIEVVLDPGQYYLVVTRYSGGTDYRIEVSTMPVGSLPEDQAGDSADLALDLGMLGDAPQEIRDWVGAVDRDDYYRFELAAPAMLELTMTVDQSDADVELRRAGSDEVLANSTNFATEPERIGLRLEPDSYIVRVFIFEGSTHYNLTVAATPLPDPAR